MTDGKSLPEGSGACAYLQPHTLCASIRVREGEGDETNGMSLPKGSGICDVLASTAPPPLPVLSCPVLCAVLTSSPTAVAFLEDERKREKIDVDACCKQGA